MIVTTAYNPNLKMISRAKTFSEQLQGTYIERGKNSLKELLLEFSSNAIIVVEKENCKFYDFSIADNQPFFFHPSLAVLRINRLKQGDNDVMVKIAELKKGDSFLDCTLGLAADAIVASFVVGSSGKVVGFESEAVLATLVSVGLQNGYPASPTLDLAMKGIEVRCINHYEGLKELPTNSFDVIYFDPMFRVGLNKSSAVNALRVAANPNPLTLDTITEAKRVAKHKIVLKENKMSGEFERLGFEIIPRSANISYGVISLNGEGLANEG